jgi:hypothetical protein
MTQRLPAVAEAMAGKLALPFRVNFHKPNIQAAKKSSVGLLRTLSDSCEKAMPGSCSSLYHGIPIPAAGRDELLL